VYVKVQPCLIGKSEINPVERSSNIENSNFYYTNYIQICLQISQSCTKDTCQGLWDDCYIQNYVISQLTTKSQDVLILIIAGTRTCSACRKAGVDIQHISFTCGVSGKLICATYTCNSKQGSPSSSTVLTVCVTWCRTTRLDLWKSIAWMFAFTKNPSIDVIKCVSAMKTIYIHTECNLLLYAH
jgi:hypothetical protein